jgi:hypothetical protein
MSMTRASPGRSITSAFIYSLRIPQALSEQEPQAQASIDERRARKMLVGVAVRVALNDRAGKAAAKQT